MRCRIPANDLAQKLDSTVCRYKGHPYLVRVDGTALVLYALTNTKSRAHIIAPTDPDFDIASLPLGYIQMTDTVYYLTRSAVRRTKQGLDQRALKVRTINASRAPGATVNMLMYSQGFIDMVNNKYPTLDEALNSLRKIWAGDNSAGPQIAITRHIALAIDKVGIIKVFYKTEYVGWIEPDKYVVHVPSNDMGWVVSKYLSHELSWKID